MKISNREFRETKQFKNIMEHIDFEYNSHINSLAGGIFDNPIDTLKLQVELACLNFLKQEIDLILKED